MPISPELQERIKKLYVKKNSNLCILEREDGQACIHPNIRQKFFEGLALLVTKGQTPNYSVQNLPPLCPGCNRILEYRAPIRPTDHVDNALKDLEKQRKAYFRQFRGRHFRNRG